MRLRPEFRFTFSAIKIVGLSVLAITSQGCSSLGIGYLIQAGRGQFALSNRARSITEVLKDERTPLRIRTLLGQISGIKTYGESQGLKATKNYQSYMQLDREAVSWVVSASKPLAFQPRFWSFPIVGSFTYVGWFSPDDARKYAQEVRAEGWDVDVRGARAFSTLGWFNDPVVSSMISDGPEALGELVNVVLHESVHATFYLNGQSYFNESLADFVADQMTPGLLSKLEREFPGAERAYVESERESEKRSGFFKIAYQELLKLYSDNRPEAEKLIEKSKVLTRLKAQTGARRDLNNATLIQYRTYGVGKAEFTALYESCGRRWPRFWAQIKKISEKSFTSAHEEDLGKVLLPLAHEPCPEA